MSANMILDLPDPLKGRPYRGPFKPVPRYSLVGDMLEIHYEEEPAYAERVNESLTVLRAFTDKRVVGMKVFGVASLVDAARAEDAAAPPLVASEFQP